MTETTERRCPACGLVDAPARRVDRAGLGVSYEVYARVSD